MARMAVQEKATAVAAPTRYTRDNSEEISELEALQNERNAIIEEQQDAEETEAMQPEEKHLRNGMVTCAATPNKKNKICATRYASLKSSYRQPQRKA